ncbi:MAG TPA: hypothetical protein VFT51_03920 [Bacillales bacterium]|nr:hypothetical protein [Bacillales bacterium]
MKEKQKTRKKKRDALKEVLKDKLRGWNPEPPKKPSSNIKTSA